MENKNSPQFTNNTLLWLLIGAIGSVTGGIIIIWGVQQAEHTDTVKMLRDDLNKANRKLEITESNLLDCYEGRTERAESAADWARDKFTENEKDTTSNTVPASRRRSGR